ncbi:ATPase [Megasphaera cerevisiae DSM 20462]|jgi:predicted AAA+ superfamily ATPase|uniref:ATPase n=1 Tax=Megasphaera cerevisiae DSM 20462 TaxID=1122219 RepID=A0A0J6WPR5_9FIRM|nr:ATP-binding protein [Megasphaera cerevisiae]KMO85400.1 ATPase [Megasphaera cerevisiae DSM 20462]OKY54602.1 ATPase [Megasphaera cerevisiae]SKA20235.1 hypothetical protein SAMN05660900_02822 [Megasphaera cerevisiae DSM 20462]
MMRLNVRGLIVCRDFLSDPLLQAVMNFVSDPSDEAAAGQAAGQMLEKAETLGLSGNVLRQYLLYLLGEGNNIAAASIEYSGTFDTGLEQAMLRDMNILWPYLSKKPSDFMTYTLFDAYKPAYPRTYPAIAALDAALGLCAGPAEAAQIVLHHYTVHGRGKLAKYIAFRVRESGELVGIESFPYFDWADLIGYEAQKARLLSNTENFMAGKDCNNVLLTGARGTGKSTAVKSLVCRYAGLGLRLIQIGRGQLAHLPEILEKLCNVKSKKFILFFDDLSFDENETEYKYLKSAMDGGVTPQPDNVLLYATSNRRHLLKETWHERRDDMEEVYRDDSTNESISLSDRFGLILHYAAPTQEEYLQIIAHELEKAGVSLSKEDLRIQGVRWEMEHSGRNGRIARQFVKWYLGNKK